jgi:hypothetical protein
MAFEMSTGSITGTGKARGKGTLSICAQMSTAMMSAPSCASRIAWLRPWPRAAPVMKATFPSSFPIGFHSVSRSTLGQARSGLRGPDRRHLPVDDGGG